METTMDLSALALTPWEIALRMLCAMLIGSRDVDGAIQWVRQQVASGVGNSISDLDAYKKAVKFYFPGAEIRMELTIDLIGAAGEEPAGQTAAEKKAAAPEKPKAIKLDLADFFG